MKILKYLLTLCAAFLAPLVPLLLIVGIVILIDTYYGIKAAKKQGIKVNSRRFSRVLDKSLKYSAVVILFHIINVFLLHDFIIIYTSIPFILTKLVTVFILITEGYSIDEKLLIVYDGRGFKYWFCKLIILFKHTKELTTSAKEINNDIKDITNK